MKLIQYLVWGVMLLMIILGLTSCVMTCDRPLPGDQIVEQRMHRGFERIEISGSPSVVFTQADTFGVRLEGLEKMVDNMVTEVKNHTLYVYNKGRVDLKVGFINLNWGDKDDVTVYVSSPDLVGVRVNGSGDFFCSTPLDTDVMEIVLRGSGDVSFEDIICDACTTELVGSGDININHLDARTSTAVLVGSGDIEISEANVLETDLSLRGSGDIAINFEEGCRSAQCQLAGSGDITLSGTLTHYDSKKSGSGDIDVDNLIVK
jgi:hypothetical protein